MKKLSLLCALLMVVAGTASAHDGAISLYTDESLSSCRMEIPYPPGEYGTITLLYVRDQGVAMGSSAEFRIVCTSSLVMFFPPAWEPYITQTIGTIPGDVAITGASQFGCGLDIVKLGSVEIWNVADPDTFYVKVVDTPRGDLEDGIFITACDEWNTEVKVIGGTFVLTGNNTNFPAVCNVGVESKTWGAIKSMYK